MLELLRCLVLSAPLCLTAFSQSQDEVTTIPDVHDDWVDLIGSDLADHWRQVNCDMSTFQLVDDPKSEDRKMILCTGKPTGVMRTVGVYENFVCEFEWRHMTKGWGANAGFFLWSDARPALGVPFTRSVEVQVANFDENSNWYTRHGDIFPIHGASMTPDPRYGRWQGGSRSLPLEFRAKGTGEWNHYRLTCIDGTVQLELNGELVSAGFHASPRKGHICIESEGGEVHFRDLRILPLAPDPQGLRLQDVAELANEQQRVVPIYNGLNLNGWTAAAENAWQTQDWKLVGTQAGQLSYALPPGDLELSIDFNFRKSGDDQEQAVLPMELPIRLSSGDKVQTFPLHNIAPGKWCRVQLTRTAGSWIYRINGSEPAALTMPSGEPTALVLAVETCPVEFSSLLLATEPSKKSGLIAPRVAPLKIACLGDSITYGSLVADREHNSYPAQMGRILGSGYEVRNFGQGGTTLLRAADAPYSETEAFQQALDWKPDIAIVILGTNDTCEDASRKNWTHSEDLESDSRQLASKLFESAECSRILFCTPPPIFPDAKGLEDARRSNLQDRQPRLARIYEALKEVAREDARIEFVDLGRVFKAPMTVDGVHTTPFGARAMARRLAETSRMQPGTDIPLSEQFAEREIASVSSEFNGYRRYDFSIDTAATVSVNCILVEPESPAKGHPWIWRARFFGHEPELDLELLARGYHLAYCDVSQLFGASEAMGRWDQFFELCTDFGLSKRVTLEGMSRGGLVAINWAASRSANIQAIYLDNPVCDFRSWPGGLSGKRSDSDWEACLRAYGLSEDEAMDYAHMPLDRLTPLADLRVPIFLVQGSADKVVPALENGERLIQIYRDAGGPIEVWRKPEAGHHPHGLHPVSPLLRGLLRSAGRGQNPATHAMPSAEYRGSPAGWGGGTWWDEAEKLRELGQQHATVTLVFLGDSITQGLTGSTDRVARVDGQRIFDRYQGARSALSLGISGDRTEHLLYRIQHGALQSMNPKVIVLAIGVNNVNAAGHSGFETSEGLAAVVNGLLERELASHVLVCGPFPAGPTAKDPRRMALDQVHKRAARLAEHSRVTYLDLRPLFLDEHGKPNSKMSGDHIHITAEGQEAWMAAIEPSLQALLAE
ncbi:MAG: lysophospholipase L1-like esterase/pimeloyl-ACP methyl ester carboxylesterase [Planctomycetota bacterium]|jgi:lysophospholipase L1-like esterase/pimeloyl-ACP methyl ester carboxylesterase